MPTSRVVPLRFAAALLPGSILIVSACNNAQIRVGSQTVQVTLTQAPSACARDRATIDTAAFHLDSATIVSFEKNGLCTFDMPEYNDEQALIWNGQHYGPVAHAYAYAYGRSITDQTPFNASWMLMGLVRVDAGTIPQIYSTRLNLTNGLNCLYVHHTGTAENVGWETAIGGPASDGVCRGGPAVTVGKEAEQPSTVATDYPVTVRFMEAPGRQPTLGIRCGNVWCIAGAHTPGDITAPGYGTMPPGASMKWQIKGWYDDQTLALRSGAGLAPFRRLAIVPTDNLGTYKVDDFKAGWKEVAIVNVPDHTDIGKYGTTNTGGFAFAAGTNTISIRAQDAGGQLHWYAQVVNTQYPAGHPYRQEVIWNDHRAVGIPIDGTARWHWLDHDEGVWVRCDVGCCMVYGD